MAGLDLGTITVTIEAAIADFRAQMSEVSSTMEDLGSKITPVAISAGAAFAAIGAGLAYVVAKSSEAHRSQLELATAIKASGSSLDPAAVDALGESIQRLSVFDDDAVVSSSALLTRMGMTQAQIEALTPRVADLASATGQDLVGASQGVARAIQTGMLRPLQMAGIVFDDVTKKAFENADSAQRTAIVLDALRRSVEGTAAAMTQTAGGAFAQMKNAIDNLAEAFGQTFESTAVRAMQAVGQKAQEMADAFKGSSDAMHGFVFVATGIGTALAGVVAVALALVAGWAKLQVLFAAVSMAFGAVILPILAIAAALIGVTAAGVALFDLFKANGGTVEGFFDGLVESIEYGIGSMLGLENEGRGLFRSLASAAGEYADEAGAYLSELGGQIGDWIAGGFSEAFDAASAFVSEFLSWFTGELPSGFAEATSEAGATFMAFGEYLYDTITEAFGQAFAWVSDLVSGVVDWLTGIFGRVGTAIYEAIAGAIKAVVGVLASVFGTAFSYWEQKFASIGSGIAPGAGAMEGAPGGGAPGGQFKALDQAALLALSKQTKEAGDALGKLREQLLNTANQSRSVDDAQARTIYFVDRLNDVIERGLKAQDVTEFMRELESSGASLQDLAGAATEAAKRSREAAKAEAERQGRFRAASAEGAQEAFAPMEAADTDFAAGASGVLYNLASSALGPSSVFSSALGAFGEALDNVGAQAVGGLVGQMGGFGQVVNAAAQGFQAGGPMGAIIAVIAQLASMAPTFQRLGDMVNESLGEFLQSFDRILQGLWPITEAVSMLIEMLGEILAPIFEGLGSVFYTLGTLIKGIIPIIQILSPLFEIVGFVIEKLSQVIAVVAWGVLWIVKGISNIWNGIVGAIASVFEKIADIEVFGSRPFGFMDRWANSINRARIDTDAMGDAMNDLETIISDGTMPAASAFEEGLDGAADSVCASAADTSMCEATAGFTDSVDQATESLLNVPSGYKVAAARFDAALAEAASTSTMGASVSTPGPADQGATTAPATVIENVTVVSNNPEEVWQGVQRVIEWENYRGGGSSQNAANPFAVRMVP